MVAPIIPALNEPEIERILEAAAAAGVREAGYVLLRLPLEVRDIFKEFLEREYPDRAKHVMSVIRSMRGGKDYDADLGQADERRRPLCLADRPALRDGRPPARPQRRRSCELRTDLFTAPGSQDQLDLFGGQKAA